MSTPCKDTEKWVRESNRQIRKWRWEQDHRMKQDRLYKLHSFFKAHAHVPGHPSLKIRVGHGHRSYYGIKKEPRSQFNVHIRGEDNLRIDFHFCFHSGASEIYGASEAWKEARKKEERLNKPDDEYWVEGSYVITFRAKVKAQSSEEAGRKVRNFSEEEVLACRRQKAQVRSTTAVNASQAAYRAIVKGKI